MARGILLAAAIAWFVAAIGGLVLALAGIDWLLPLLPPLTIDADAVRGAIVTIAAGAGLVAVVHAWTLVGLRVRRRWASTLAILMSALLTVLLFALAVAAVTSVAAQPSAAAQLLPAAGAATGGAAAYAVALVRLVQERRAASVSLRGPR